MLCSFNAKRADELIRRNSPVDLEITPSLVREYQIVVDSRQMIERESLNMAQSVLASMDDKPAWCRICVLATDFPDASTFFANVEIATFIVGDGCFGRANSPASDLPGSNVPRAVVRKFKLLGIRILHRRSYEIPAPCLRAAIQSSS